eukprot:12276912-Alexandrium_andersonii.AAC.1
MSRSRRRQSTSPSSTPWASRRAPKCACWTPPRCSAEARSASDARALKCSAGITSVGAACRGPVRDGP